MDVNTLMIMILGLVFIIPLIYVAWRSKEGPFHGYYSQNNQTKKRIKKP